MAKTVSIKPTNPKDIIGSDKLPLHLVPTSAIALESLAFLDGALKYGRQNWRRAGARASIYYDAALRHLHKWFEGEDIDEESGVPHLAHVRACIGILIDADMAGKLTDDRALPVGYLDYVRQLTPHVARLKRRHAPQHPHHFTIADRGSS